MKIRRNVSAALFALLALTAAGARAAEPSGCPARAAWVKSPSLPDFGKEPADNCAFNQYAWQSFLYLTQAARPHGALLFETFPSVSGVFPGSARTLSKCESPDADGDFRRVFLVRRTKSKDAATSQAGSGGAIVDQAGQVTYYE